jgi:hypothetical protein
MYPVTIYTIGTNLKDKTPLPNNPPLYVYNRPIKALALMIRLFSGYEYAKNFQG